MFATLLEPVRIGPVGLPKLTLGWQALDWTAEYLLQPDGPDAGAPWRFTDEQARFVLWWYAIDENGRFVYRRGMFRRLKGHGKDPMGAALCAVELVGPCRFGGFDAAGEPVAIPHSAPWVITAAVNLEQTKNTMTLFPSMFSDASVNEYRLDIGKELIYANDQRGRLQAVTSSPRALEGKRTSFALKNEPHHWLESNEGLAMSQVIARNLAKARDGDARALSISNAHNPGEGSDAELDYEAYQSLQVSGFNDFLYDSLEAPSGVDLADADQIKAALRAARGDSTWLDVDRITAEILDPRTTEGEARRFYFNQIFAGGDSWLEREDWDILSSRQVVPAGTPIVIGFDGSDSDDWTAIRCETIDGYQFTPTFADGKRMIWDPANSSDGYIPRGEVNAAIAYLFDRYKVERLYADPPFFQSEIDAWAARYGDKVVLRWATYRPRQMADALERFRTDILVKNLNHDQCPITSQHIQNCHADRRPQGILIRKDRKVSKNKIDAVLSSVLAHEAAFDAKAAGWGGNGRKKLTRVRGRLSGY